MNGMIQMVISPEKRAELLSLVAEWCPDMKDTLTEKQSAHHVTLAYKPSDEVADSLPPEGTTLTFSPTSARADGEICAIFGDIYTEDGSWGREDVHMTLRANGISPVLSERLNGFDHGLPVLPPDDMQGQIVHVVFGSR